MNVTISGFCDSSREEADICDVGPRFRGSDGFLEVFGQSATPSQPCKYALDNPSTPSDGRQAVIFWHQPDSEVYWQTRPASGQERVDAPPFRPPPKYAREPWCYRCCSGRCRSAMISASVTETASQTPASRQRRNRR